MNCDQARDAFADDLAGALPKDQKQNLEAHLADCLHCREETASLSALWSRLADLPEAQPSRESTRQFQLMLQAYAQGLEQAQPPKPAAASAQPDRSRLPKSPSSPRDAGATRNALASWLAQLWPRRPARQFALALLLFCAGLLAGGLTLRREPLPAQNVALTQLRDEVAGLKQLVMLSLLEQPSASERLRGVAWANQLQTPDHQVLTALLHALQTDPNVNVRLAVVNALRPFVNDDTVRKALLQSLEDQSSPLVQIELISLMVDLKAADSIPRLKELLERPDLNPSVRERAQWGLDNLT